MKQALEAADSDSEALLNSRKSPEAASALHDCFVAPPSKQSPSSVRSEKVLEAAVGTFTNACCALLGAHGLPVAVPLLLAVRQ